MNPIWIDHGIAIFLMLVTPFLAVRSFRKLAEQARRGEPGVRLRQYWKTIARQWALCAFVLFVWILSGRELSRLGLGLQPGFGLWIGTALTLVAVGLLFRQVRMIRRNRKTQERLVPRFEQFRHLLPSDDAEWRWWIALSLTAGVCEEVVYRGFLIAYFGFFGGTLGAVAGSSVAFALGHSYQGWKGMARTGGVALIAAGLYVLTGSLWAPMLLHFVIDFTSGQIARDVLRVAPPPQPAGAQPAARPV